MSNWTKYLLLTVLLLSACAPAPINAPASPALAVINGALWDGSRMIPQGTVVLHDGQIEAAGPAVEVTIPGGATIIDAKGSTILPGLIDDHVHNAAEPEIRGEFLKAGVTTICDAGAGALQLRQYQDEQVGGALISRAFFAGPFLSPPEGYPADTDASAHLGVGTP
ncbi:MAG: hypothetical protein EG825_17510, partial [Rhodocyclaceae bacterium]|nr:hypothetical protein [Rhodocyclaceae bacterium]